MPKGILLFCSEKLLNDISCLVFANLRQGKDIVEHGIEALDEQVALQANPNIYFTEYVSHDWLFPKVKAVVHHGGAGTTAAGLRYGKPTLVVPFGGDQPFWGSRVYSMGCGPKPLSREKLTVQTLTQRLVELTAHESYRVAAEECGMRLSAENGTSNAADIVENEIRAWQEKNQLAPKKAD